MANKTLYHPLNAPKGQSFPTAQAEKIMAMKSNGGWTDQKPSNQSNGDITDGSKKAVKKAAKKSNDPTSD